MNAVQDWLKNARMTDGLLGFVVAAMAAFQAARSVQIEPAHSVSGSGAYMEA